MLAVLILGVVTQAALALVTSRVYTLDADFDEGTLVGVEHETVHNQLQLTTTITTLPFIWVPNLQGTVSKIDTVTGKELGRYYVSSGSDSSPSRTTVDLQGNCWVGCRQRGTVVKIGLFEAGQWIDRNGDGICQTSTDANNNGNIDASEILPWGQDECVLYEVVLVPGHEGTYAPGTYPGPYDTNYWGTAPRGLAIDSSNNLWAGTWMSAPSNYGKYYYINGATGAIDNTKTVDLASLAHNSYGAVIDQNGILWSSCGPTGAHHILRIDTTTNPVGISVVNLNHDGYGVALDHIGHLFATSYYDKGISRIDTTTLAVNWFGPKAEISYARGVACTGDNDVWVANSGGTTVSRYDNNGNWKATITVGNSPTGVAVDATGKVWACNQGDLDVSRIDPATNTVDLKKTVINSVGHYGYSDMTGIVVRSITTKTGTWTVDFDSEEPDTPWTAVSWTGLTPTGTSINVRVRSSNDKITWSGWETAGNGIPLSTTPNGRYLQIEATLQVTAGEESPILYDLAVTANAPPNVIPEVPLGTIVVSASMIAGLASYIAIPRLRNSKHQHP